MQAIWRRRDACVRCADRPRPTTRRCHGDSGAALVEAAFIAPLLFALLFGIFDFSGMMQSKTAASHTVRSGSRVLSAAANDPMADQAALKRMDLESAGLSTNEIDFIVIWHASTTSESVPAGCIPTSTSAPNTVSVGVSDGGTDAMGACNVYVRPGAPGGAFDMATGGAAQPASYYFGCTGPADVDASHKVDCRWPAINRFAKTTPRSVTPVQNPDLVGVYIKADHKNYTGILGKTLTITDKVITQLEPQGYKLS